MNIYVTEICAIDPQDGSMKRYEGPNVPGISTSDAEAYCQNNGLGYCKIIGTLVAEIPCNTGTFDPDFSRQINYDNQTLN